jgi:deoxycytidylate deaminase
MLLAFPAPSTRPAFHLIIGICCLDKRGHLSDEDGAIKSVGWNDVPFKQVPCLLRDVDDLIGGQDKTAFSTFELSDKGFRDHLKKLFPPNQQAVAGGRSCAFCFKDAINSQTKDNDRSMTRSLHAEENAFLQISKTGGGGLKGGHLYTTASPCELCSKKAFQLGIARIWFVDPYPGISQKQILESGDKDFRPQMMLFFGAIGDAYHRLYDPLMAHKDEINAYVAEAGAPIDFFPLVANKKVIAKKRP